MPENEIAIRVRRLSKDFGNRRVLRDVDLDVPKGQCIGLTGANGAGKTTLLRCLASIVRPTSGEVLWFGTLPASHPNARRMIGMTAHESRLYPHLTLRENLIFAARMCRVDQPRRRADQWLWRVGLPAHADRLPVQVSKGMRQRTAAARALIHDPRILLLDEPFSSLDAQGSDWLEGVLTDLRDRGTTICFATHDRAKARRLADRMLELQQGALQESSPDADARQAGVPAARAA